MKVTIQKHNGQHLTTVLPQWLSWLGETLTRHLENEVSEEIAAAAMSTSKIQTALLQRLSETIAGECKQLCTFSAASMLQKTSSEQLLSFNIYRLTNEFKSQMPSLMTVLIAAAASTRERGQKIKTDARHEKIATCLAAILLRERSDRMLALHYVIGFALHSGGATSHTFERLSSLGQCITDKSVLRKLDEQCQHFDQEVLQWKESVENYMMDKTFVLQTDFQLIGDNLDLQVAPHIQSVQYHPQSLHWFNLLAVKHRVQAAHLTNTTSQRPVTDLMNSDFLPSSHDHCELRKHFVILVGRVLVERLASFEVLRGQAIYHVRHKYSNVMKSKTEMVSCLTEPKNA